METKNKNLSIFKKAFVLGMNLFFGSVYADISTGSDYGTVSSTVTHANVNLYTSGKITVNTGSTGSFNVTTSLNMSDNTIINVNSGAFVVGNTGSFSFAGASQFNFNGGSGSFPGFAINSTARFNINSAGARIKVTANGDMSLSTSAYLYVGPGDTLVVNGNFFNYNTSSVVVDGTLIINGNFKGYTSATVTGNGTMTTTGSIITYNSATVFGSTYDCNTGPCSGNNLCTFSNTVGSNQSICGTGTPTTFTGNNPGSGATYQWQSRVSTTSFSNITSATTQNYSSGSVSQTTYYRRKAVYGGCTSYSTPITISIVSPTVSISSTSTSICSGTSVTFTATPTNGGSNPSYQWKVNGSNVGSNSSTYTSSTLSQGDVVTCVMSVSGSCAGSYTSNSVTMTVNAVPSITSVTSTQPVTCPSLNDGTISVVAAGSNLEYSINNGSSYQSGNSFTGLSNGTYNVKVRNSAATTCLATYGSSVVFNNTCLDPAKCYEILSYNSSKIMEVENNATTADAPIIQKSYTAGPHQQWKFNQVGSYYEIRNVNSGLSAEVKNGVTTWETFITQNSYSGANYQQWSMVSSGGLYNIVNRQTGLYWDVRWGSTDNGVNLVQWGANGGNNQKWNVVEVGCAVACNVSTVATITPSTNTACASTDFNLSVPDGGAGVSYAWTGAGLSSSTSRNPSVNVSSAGSNAYSVTVSNTNGCRNTASTTISINAIPSISAQPSTVGQSICAGNAAAALSVTAAGAGLSYQWYGNTSASNTGGSIISGANSASYTPPSNVVGVKYYYCIVSGTCAPAASSNVSGSININVVPAAPSVPTIAAICNGNAAVLSKATPAATGAYFWYRNSTGGSANANPYTTSALASSTSYYLIDSVAATGCKSARTTVTVTVNGNIVNNTIGSDETVCANSSMNPIAATASLSGGDGTYTYTWEKSTTSSASGFAIVNGAGSASLNPTAISATSWYRRNVSSGGCTSVSNAIQKVINNNNYTWSGNLSTNWHTAGNWCGNVVPNSATDVTITSGLTNYPVVTSNAYVRNLTLNNGSRLTTENGGNIYIYGNWTGNGAFTPKDGSTVVFTASQGTQTISGTGTQMFFNLDKSGASSLALTDVASVEIRRGGRISIENGSFDMNSRPVRLKSKVVMSISGGDTTYIDSTASLARLGGRILNSSSFEAERYIYAKRGIRYLGSSSASMTFAGIKDSTKIYGPLAGGFDSPNVVNTTVKEYQESRNWNIDKCFLSIANVNAQMTAGKGYYMYFYGNRNTVGGANEAAVLSMKGIPNMGSINMPVTYTNTGALGWNLVANPYPSVINWDSPNWTKTNIGSAVYIWDPYMGTKGGYYSYVGGIASDGRADGGYISASQAFFVKATGAFPVLTINESTKVNTSMNGNSSLRTAPLSYVTFKLTANTGDVDYLTFRYDESGTDLSALKLMNSKTNLYGKDPVDNTTKSIMVVSDSAHFKIPMYVESSSATTYTLQVMKIVGDAGQDPNLKIINNVTGEVMDLSEGLKLEFVNQGRSDMYSFARVATTTHVITSTQSHEVPQDHISIYPTDVKVAIPVLHNPGNLHLEISIVDAHGAKKGHTINTNNAEVTLHHFHHIAHGVYVVHVKAGAQEYGYKVVK